MVVADVLSKLDANEYPYFYYNNNDITVLLPIDLFI